MISVDYEQVVYNGNGSQTAWPYSFPIYDGDVVRLILLDADGTETDITQDYFVDVPGSTVYYPGYAPGEEPPVADQPPKLQSGQKLIVYRDTEITQDSNLGDKWPFDVIEKGLDKLTMILQEKAFALARCLKISQGQAAEIDNYDPTVPLEAGKVICGNAAGDGFEAREALMEVNGAWDGEGRQIHSVADPTADQDAVTKKYADNRMDNNFMKLQPDGEAWEARNLPISNVAGPALIKDAANKDYVDRILSGYSGQGERMAIFDNVAQMQAAELVPSQMAVTLGYHDVNDGGAGVYTIRDKGADTPDGGSIIEIPGTDYVAELITDGYILVEQWGVYGDGEHDCSDRLQVAINYALTNNVALYGYKEYLLENPITIGTEGIQCQFTIKLKKVISNVVGYAIEMKGFWHCCILDINYFKSETGGLIRCVTDNADKTWVEYTRFISSFMSAATGYDCIHWEVSGTGFINDNEINVARFNRGNYGAYLVKSHSNVFLHCGFEYAGLYLDTCTYTTCIGCRMAEYDGNDRKLLYTVGYTTSLLFIGGTLTQLYYAGNCVISGGTRGQLIFGSRTYRIHEGNLYPQDSVENLTTLTSQYGTISGARWSESGSIAHFECTFTNGENGIPATAPFIEGLPSASYYDWGIFDGGEVGLVKIHNAYGSNNIYTHNSMPANASYQIQVTFLINRL